MAVCNEQDEGTTSKCHKGSLKLNNNPRRHVGGFKENGQGKGTGPETSQGYNLKRSVRPHRD